MQADNDQECRTWPGRLFDSSVAPRLWVCGLWRVLRRSSAMAQRVIVGRPHVHEWGPAMHRISLGSRHREDRNHPPLTASPTLNEEEVTNRPLLSTKPVQRAPSITATSRIRKTVPEPRLRCSEPLCSGRYWDRTSDFFRVRDKQRAQRSPTKHENSPWTSPEVPAYSWPLSRN